MNRGRGFRPSCYWGFVRKVVLFAREVSGYKLIGDVAPRFPCWFVFSGTLHEEFQWAVPFPAVPEEAVDKSCFSIEVPFREIRWGGRVPVAFGFGD